MARIRKVDATAKQRLKKRSKSDQERDEYRSAVGQLDKQGMIEVEPDEGETLRKIKLNLSRAAKEIGREIQYGETQENTVLVWLAGETPKRRGRRPKAAIQASM
jgi:hypothetical protein